ncbi:MAG TPA: hypothetical protein GXX49_00300 [Clostridiaceae bacterium]|nr:hypothetical protein [Clostridiaceae bacterium]
MEPFLYYSIQVLSRAGNTLLNFLPYLVAGTVIGELLKLVPITRNLKNGASRFRVLSVFIFSIIGIISPLCTYGTVPVVVQLFVSGVPIAPLVSFLSASSMMNPQLFIMTWGGIGYEMSIARTLAAFVFSVLTGLILYLIPEKWIVNSRVEGISAMQHKEKHFSYKSLFSGMLKTLEYTGFYMVIGIIAGAVIEIAIPGRWINFIFRPESNVSVAVASILGIPLYACGGATIPLVSSLIKQGMSKGAALSFFTVGPATRITSLAAVAAILKPAFIIFYVMLLVVFSIFAGIIYV